jgi:hypothetical protein
LIKCVREAGSNDIQLLVSLKPSQKDWGYYDQSVVRLLVDLGRDEKIAYINIVKTGTIIYKLVDLPANLSKLAVTA